MSAILDSTITINRPIEIPARRIWDVCTEPISKVSGHWIKSMKTDANNLIVMQILNENSDSSTDDRPLFVTCILNPRHILKAFRIAVGQGLTHCGHYGIEDLDNSDACTSDLVLQIACYGKVIY